MYGVVLLIGQMKQNNVKLVIFRKNMPNKIDTNYIHKDNTLPK